MPILQEHFSNIPVQKKEKVLKNYLIQLLIDQKKLILIDNKLEKKDKIWQTKKVEKKKALAAEKLQNGTIFKIQIHELFVQLNFFVYFFSMLLFNCRKFYFSLVFAQTYLFFFGFVCTDFIKKIFSIYLNSIRINDRNSIFNKIIISITKLISKVKMSSKTPVKIFYLKNGTVKKDIRSRTSESNCLIHEKKMGNLFNSDKKHYQRQKISSIIHLSSVLQKQRNDQSEEYKNAYFFNTEIINQHQGQILKSKNQKDLDLFTYYDNASQLLKNNQFSQKLFYYNTLEEKKQNQKNLAFIIKDKWNKNRMEKQMRKTQKNIKKTLQSYKSPEKIKDQMMSNSLKHKFHSKSQTKQMLKLQFFDFAKTKANFYQQKQKMKINFKDKEITQVICVKNNQNQNLNDVNLQNKLWRRLNSTTLNFNHNTKNIDQTSFQINQRNKTTSNIKEEKKHKKMKKFLNLTNQQDFQKKWWSKNQPKSKFFQLRRALIN